MRKDFWNNLENARKNRKDFPRVREGGTVYPYLAFMVFKREEVDGKGSGETNHQHLGIGPVFLKGRGGDIALWSCIAKRRRSPSRNDTTLRAAAGSEGRSQEAPSRRLRYFSP